jgi:hypothetical protein
MSDTMTKFWYTLKNLDFKNTTEFFFKNVCYAKKHLRNFLFF